LYSGNTKCISQTGPQEACTLQNTACGLNSDSGREKDEHENLAVHPINSKTKHNYVNQHT